VALPGGKRPGSQAVAAAGAAAVKAQSMAVASGKALEKLRSEELPGDFMGNRPKNGGVKPMKHEK